MTSEQVSGEVSVALLSWRCDASIFRFETTADLEPVGQIPFQARALEAVRFGVGIEQEGYHLYVMGPAGSGKRGVIKDYLERLAADQRTTADWCYIHSFADPARPRLLRLPPGRGAQLQADMRTLVEDLQHAVTAALESEEHQSRVQEVEEETKNRHERSVQDLSQRTQAEGIKLVRTPGGYAMAPMQNGNVIDPEEYEKLSPEDKQAIHVKVERFQRELQELIEALPQQHKELRERIKKIYRETTGFAIGHSLAQVKQRYTDLPDVLAYLDSVQQDVLEHADDFRKSDEEPNVALELAMGDHKSFLRYQINVLVSHLAHEGAPLVFEEHPSYQNLIGRVEHRAQMGTLVTDFTLIKPGALHLANGGYLVMEALKLLQQPYAWEGLKRALQTGRIQMESLAESLSLVATVSLQPEPTPFKAKVILLGDRFLYYLLFQHDPDFAQLFKVAADFEDHVDLTPDACQVYARLLADIARRAGLRPLNRNAVARVLEHAARVADHSERLTANLQVIADILSEANFYAAQDKEELITDRHIDTAIEQQIHRVDRLRSLVQQEIHRGTLFIDTDGRQVGQINGLSVMDLGNFRFGRPARITATVRLGRGEIVDIEREVELGGAIHSKGVLILASFLAARYAQHHPLSLRANLVFEQSYGMIEGDSASLAELCVLLCTLANAPIAQFLAVTGSVNQHGQVQAIGGVNEKIEGFFDICDARGLTGNQGVIIPSANVQNLMLQKRVVTAVEAGKFHVYAVRTVDDAIAHLTEMPLGEPTADGTYAANTFNGQVAARLQHLLTLRRHFATEDKPSDTRADSDQVNKTGDAAAQRPFPDPNWRSEP